MFVSVQIFSQTSYSSATDGDWDSSFTWSPNGIPGADDSVTIDHDITITDPRSCASLEIPFTDPVNTLTISGLIVKKLKEKNYRVFMTRSVDRTVSLEKRAEIAERVNVDLFISIHANASYYKASGGFETYYLNNKSNQAIKKVEEVENKGLEGVIVGKALYEEKFDIKEANKILSPDRLSDYPNKKNLYT